MTEKKEDNSVNSKSFFGSNLFGGKGNKQTFNPKDHATLILAIVLLVVLLIAALAFNDSGILTGLAPSILTGSGN